MKLFRHTAFLLLLLPALPAAAALPDSLHAAYQTGGIQNTGAEVTAWQDARRDTSAAALARVHGTPVCRLVRSRSGESKVVRFDGESALWQAAGGWGILSGDRTLVTLVRVNSAAPGFLFDGSTVAGMTRAQVRGDHWFGGVESPPISNARLPGHQTIPFVPGAWQIHSFIFRRSQERTTLVHESGGERKEVAMASSSALSGLILGADVTTSSGLQCDVAELLVFGSALDAAQLKSVTDEIAARWGTPEDLPEDKQPKPPGLPDDPRIFRTMLRAGGEDGVHTYRIPGLATTPKGTLVAVFDARNKNGGDLPGDIDVGMMRSTDDGTTWNPMQRIMDYDAAVPGSRGNGVGDPAVLVDQKTGHIFVVALWSKGARAWNGSGPGMTPEETGQLVLVKSTDDGLTWSAPVSLTQQMKKPEWRLLFNGPGSGIQLKDGSLVVAAQFKDAQNVPHSCFIRSTDQGTTWTISPAAIPDKPPTSEAQIVECADGTLLLSMRNESRAGKRAWARWDGARWSEPWLDVTDPTCMASIIRHPSGTLIFSNPDHASKRVALTIRTSTDNGKTWSAGNVLDPGTSMYSSLTVLRDGQIGVVYENGKGLAYARFPLEWIDAPKEAALKTSWNRLPPLTDPLGVASPFAGVSNGVLIVAGGANFPDKMPWDGGKKVWHDSIHVLEKPDGEWREAGKLPRPLAYGVSLTAGGTMHWIGGSDADRHYADVHSMEWRSGALVASDVTPGALPIPLANAAGAVDANQNIYVACGSGEPGEKAASNRVFTAAFHGATPAWRELPPLPAEPRILPVAAAQGETFYLCGGAALEPKDGKIVRRYLTDAWSYTVKAGWKRLADMPKPCVAAPSPAPVVDGGILLIGGDDGSLAGFTPPDKHPGFPGNVLRYDIATNVWTIAGKTPAPRATLPCVEWNGQFILPSGEIRPGVRSPEVWSIPAQTARQ